VVEKTRVDTVIVGAGIAGLSAAFEADQLGAKVVVLEKLKAARGNTYYSGGGSLFKVSASWQEMVQEADRTGKGKVDLGLVKTFAQKVNGSIDWLAAQGLEWFEAYESMPVSGREASCIAQDSLGKSRVKGYGRAICRTLVSAVEKRGIDVWYQTRAEKILTEGDGKIVGLRVKRGSDRIELKTGSVILATGGFQGNKDMVKKYLEPSLTKAKYSGSPLNTGDGHVMALELGAQLVNADQWHASLRNKHRINPYPRLQYGSILINSSGQRFVNEIQNTKDHIAKDTLRQKGCWGAIVFDEQFRRLSTAGFQEHLGEFLVKAIPPVRKTELHEIEEYLIEDGTLIRASSLREVSERLAVPYSNLENTIEEYNDNIENYQWQGIKPHGTPDPCKIETPPFYAEKVLGRFNCTLGGIKINQEAQVMNQNGEPIGGLYAAGEIIGGFYYDNYQVITGYLPVCLVFGRIAGINAAKAALSLTP